MNCYAPENHAGARFVHVEKLRCMTCDSESIEGDETVEPPFSALPAFPARGDWCSRCILELFRFECNLCDSKDVVLAQA